MLGQRHRRCPNITSTLGGAHVLESVTLYHIKRAVFNTTTLTITDVLWRHSADHLKSIGITLSTIIDIKISIEIVTV